MKTNTGKDPEGFTKVGGKGKGGKKYQKKNNKDKLSQQERVKKFNKLQATKKAFKCQQC